MAANIRISEKRRRTVQTHQQDIEGGRSAGDDVQRESVEQFRRDEQHRELQQRRQGVRRSGDGTVPDARPVRGPQGTASKRHQLYQPARIRRKQQRISAEV